MKVSLNWLKDYLDLSGITVKEISGRLTMSGLEVEEITNQTEIYKGFVVGFVKDKKKHPNADRLSVCTVDTGSENLQVICGAPNVEAGQKVVFSPVGTVIPKGNFKISKAKIRGVESFGMICAEDELELSDDHEGIMILDPSLKEGTPITEALGLNDVIFEIAITPNRPDALSHFGVARDLAALFDLQFKVPELSLKESADDVSKAASVDIKDAVNCPRYSARVVKNVTIRESPEWLKERISAIGLRPINNVVDITNFVMYETGQPLHAFDLNKLNGNKIVVRSTDSEEKFVTLDSKERKLPKGTLLICDAEKAVAVAGVMGGENSEINDATKDILIESAHFNPSSIRKTSKSLGLSTEASYRFERGVDPEGTTYAAERTASLIAELGGGSICTGVLDEYPGEKSELEVQLRFGRITKLLGYEIKNAEVVRILMKLGFKIVRQSETEVTVSVPSFRPDIEREVDLIEEIARINGYDNIPTISKISITLNRKADESAFADRLKDVCTALGFFEMINNPLQSEKTASVTGTKIPILNPQSLDMAYLRTSMIPGALATVAKNINSGEKDTAFFEIGNVFNKKSESGIKTFDDFTETPKLLMLLTGKIREKTWYLDEESSDFYFLKGAVNSLLSKISLDNVLNDSYYHSNNSIYAFYFTKNLNGKELGSGGKVKKEVLKQFDINQDVFCFEFDIEALRNIDTGKSRYIEPLKYPKVLRDFAFIFDKEVKYEEVISFVMKSGSKLLKNAEVFDIFESESIGKDKKSMAFALEYYSGERTLTEDEVEKEFLSLISAVSKKFNAKLRG